MSNLLQIRLPVPSTAAGLVAAGHSARAKLTRSHTIIMSAIFAGALVVGYLLLPGANERIAMLQQDGHNQQAMALLEKRFNAGDRSQRTMFQLQRLYEQRGDLANAQQLLELLAQQRPKDPQIQRQLALFYKQTQNEPAYLQALERQLAVRHSEPVCKELIGLYRGSGNFEAEQRTIESCRRNGYRRPEDIIRLAYLVATDGRLADASAILRSVDDRRRLRTDRDRRFFFTSLIDDGQSDEAQRRALRWLKGSQDVAFALELIDGLVEEKRHDLAVNLAREIGVPGDAVSLTVAELLLDRNQEVAAKTYLRGWFEAAKLTDPDLTHRFIAAALDADDPELAYMGGVKFGLTKLGQGDLVALAEALSAIDQPRLFQDVRRAIEPQTLKDNPLLAAAIEVERGANEPARQLLSRVQVDGLDEWRLALWARLMETTGRRPTVLPPPPRPTVAQPPPPVIKRSATRLKEARDRRAQRRQRARQVPQQPAQQVAPQPPRPAQPGGG